LDDIMIRNVVNHLGVITGTLELPDETTEDQWAAALAMYATPPTTVPPVPAVEAMAITETGSVTTSSGTESVVGGLSNKPVSGTYSIDFTANAFTGGTSAQGEFGLYVDGVLLPETRRELKCSLSLLGGLVTVSLNTIGVGTCTGSLVQLNGNQTVEVKFKSNNGGTIGFSERVLKLLKVV
jgi:hypothetical protein